MSSSLNTRSAHAPATKTALAAAILAAGTITAQAEIEIGIAGPFTGSAAFLGEQLELGTQRAIADINAAGGVLGEQITATLVDDACDPDQAAAAAQQLISADVKFVVGHLCSSSTIAAMGLYEQAKISMMSPASTNPRVTDEGGENVFRVIGRDDDQAVVAAKLIAERFADRKIAVLSDGGTYGLGLGSGVRSELDKLGITVGMFEQFEPDTASFADIVDQLVANDIGLIYITGNRVQDLSLLALQAKERLPDVQIVSGDSLSSDDFLLVAGDAAVGTLFTFGPDPRLLPSAADVTAAFRDDELYEPAGFTLYSYAVVQAWAQAVTQAGTAEYGAVNAAFKSGEFDTVIGKIGFDDKGDVTGISNFVIFEYNADGYEQLK